MAVGTGFASRTAKNIRRMAGAGSRVGGALSRTFGGSSGTDGLARGLKGAWGGAGGGGSLARRAGIGAIAGGLTTGSISSLRGNDFWEGAKSGAAVGAGLGTARHGYKMGESLRGTGLRSNLASANSRGRSIGDNIGRATRSTPSRAGVRASTRRTGSRARVGDVYNRRRNIISSGPTTRSHQVQARHPRSNPAVQAKASRAQLGNPGVSQQVKTLQRQFPTAGQAQSVVNRNYR